MNMIGGDSDPWLGMDKLYHVAMCLSLTFVFYGLVSLSPYRRHAISIGSAISLLAGAAKEAADHLGYFRSSGASIRDALADILGVCIASIALSLFRSSTSSISKAKASAYDPEAGTVTPPVFMRCQNLEIWR